MWSVLLIDLKCGANNWTGYDSVYDHICTCAVGVPTRTVQCGVYKMYLYDSWSVNPVQIQVQAQYIKGTVQYLNRVGAYCNTGTSRNGTV